MKEDALSVVENSFINDGYYLMKIESPYLADRVKPGQFVMVKVSGTTTPLLKRPLGILNAEPPYIWLYYQVVGTGTQILAQKKPGDKITILGPLGNTFPELQNSNILIIAGGIGIVPVYFAANRLALTNSITFLYGAKSESHLNLTESLAPLPLKGTHLYTDDGTVGKKGLVTGEVKNIIRQNQIDTVFACGPDIMFKTLNGILDMEKTANYISMEALMGCGFGICYSCAVKTGKSEYKKVCSDGPIFKLEEIAW